MKLIESAIWLSSLDASKWRGMFVRLIAIGLLLAGGMSVALGYVRPGQLLLFLGIVSAFTGLLLNILFGLCRYLAARGSAPNRQQRG